MRGGTFMQPRRSWAGIILSAIPVLFVLFDGAIHLMVIPPVVEAFTKLGYPVNTSRALGVIELVCIVLYLIPRTSVLGAILLTGYLGGWRPTFVSAARSSATRCSRSMSAYWPGADCSCVMSGCAHSFLCGGSLRAST